MFRKSREIYGKGGRTREIGATGHNSPSVVKRGPTVRVEGGRRDGGEKRRLRVHEDPVSGPGR